MIASCHEVHLTIIAHLISKKKETETEKETEKTRKQILVSLPLGFLEFLLRMQSAEKEEGKGKLRSWAICDNNVMWYHEEKAKRSEEEKECSSPCHWDLEFVLRIRKGGKIGDKST
jgi:hypothetical protein